MSGTKEAPAPEPAVSEADQQIMDVINTVVSESFAKGTSAKFSLTAPDTLTVKKRDGTFAKKPHIGGEEFVCTGVYMGKRGKMIFQFQPTAAADYAQLELTEKQAQDLMGDFEAYAAQIIGRDLQLAKREAAEQSSLEAERAKLSDPSDVYSDLGFGSW
ncbi:MAG: hypothetical protein H7276_24140 [Caulobacter sp.]|nr:hypothetical protein [Vitreoscilla sp.]